MPIIHHPQPFSKEGSSESLAFESELQTILIYKNYKKVEKQKTVAMGNYTSLGSEGLQESGVAFSHISQRSEERMSDRPNAQTRPAGHEAILYYQSAPA